jgi:uncharacterized protein involved in exopolysaccharide biosynthesis
MADGYEEEKTQGLPDFVRDPVGLLRRRWRWMVAGVLVGLLGTAGFALTRVPLYKATARVLLAPQRISESLVPTTTVDNPVETLDALLAEALSQQKLVGVIEKFDLFPEERTRYPAPVVAGMMRGSISTEIIESSIAARPMPGMRTPPSKVLAISYEDADPAVAAAVTNELARLLQAEGLRMSTQQARLTTEFLKRELESTETALREQKEKIAAFEEAHRGELPADLDAHQRRVERLIDERKQLAQKVAEGETDIARAAAEGGGAETTASPQQRLDELRGQLAKAQSVYTDSHPAVVSLKRQVASAEKEVAQGGGGVLVPSGRQGIVAATQREVAQTRATLEATERELADLDARIARIPSNETELAGLQQRAQVLQDTYFEFLGKVKDAELAESLDLAQQGSRVSVMDEAQPPLAPEKGRLKIVLAGLMASLGLGVAVGVLLELRDPVLATSQGVEDLTGIPVLGTVPRIS